MPAQGPCLSKGRINKAVVISNNYPALLCARGRHARWGTQDRRLYQRHRWRSEGFHGEAKTWYGLGCAVRRGLDNMKIQAYLTVAAVNLKRLAVLAVLWALRVAGYAVQSLLRARRALAVRHGLAVVATA